MNWKAYAWLAAAIIAACIVGGFIGWQWGKLILWLGGAR